MSVTVRRPTNGRPVVAEAVVTTAVPPVPFEHEDLVVRRGGAAAAT